MIQVIQSNYLLWAICFIMFSATWNIDFLNCTCTLLEDGTKGSQSVAKLKTWVLSPKSYCESLFKLEIWRVLEVLSDWPGTCKVFSQVSPITFFFWGVAEQRLSEPWKLPQRSAAVDAWRRHQGYIGKSEDTRGRPILHHYLKVWKWDVWYHQDESPFLSAEAWKLIFHWNHGEGFTSASRFNGIQRASREWSSQNDRDLVSFSP